MRLTNKYIKKSKSILHKRNKKTKKNRHVRKIGGHIDASKIFENILSLGFEIETTDLIKLTLTEDEIYDKFILVNSALTNADLEYGFVDPDEYTYMKETRDETFKITNDSAEDTEFNELVKKLYGENEQQGGEEFEEDNYDEYEHQDNEYDENNYDNESEKQDDKIFVLKIPPNQYLNDSEYDIKFREDTGELINYNSFTDTEFISTYYKPVKSANIIKEYLFKSIRDLSSHLNQLVTINNTKMIIKQNNEEIEISQHQSYVLPNTTLVYFNSSIKNVQNYNIREKLTVVIQLTFSCNITYCYRIMKQLLSMQNVDIYKKELSRYSGKNKKVRELLETLNDIHLNFDDYTVTNSMNIVNLLFNNYNNTYKTYPLDNNNVITKTIKSYMFLIIYKLFNYLNSVFIRKAKENAPENMLKKYLSFAVRHYNYNLFLEIKKIINNAFFANSSDTTNASTIINQLLDEKILNEEMYDSTYIKNEKMKLNEELKNDINLQSKYYGDPLFSIKSYFDYFDKFNDDWLVTNNIDVKSTKFDLENDIIIIEFRDFPLYCYLELFLMADDNVKNEILQNSIGTFNMKILNYFIKSK
jgi:hypothetical protein